jgi:hypothetical protein
LRQKGLDMRPTNIGSHSHGNRGYDRMRPRWEKEDVDRLMDGKIKRWSEFEDRLQHEFIWAQCHKDENTGKYVTYKKKKLKSKLSCMLCMCI